MVSVIIVNYNGLSVIRQSIASVPTYSPGCEIIVVDNGSTDESVATIGHEFPEVILVPLDRNAGFGAANNRGVERASGELLFFLNNDAFLLGDVPAALAQLLHEQGGAGICAPRLENADGSFQLSTGFDPSILQEWKTRRWHARGSSIESRVHSGSVLPVDWVTGAALMIPASLFREVEGFDEDYFMYFEDADLCRKVRNTGRSILFEPHVSVTHLRGTSIGEHPWHIQIEYRRSQLLYYRKHRSAFSLIMLRVYLMFKFFIVWISSRGAEERRTYARSVMDMALSGELLRKG